MSTTPVSGPQQAWISIQSLFDGQRWLAWLRKLGNGFRNPSFIWLHYSFILGMTILSSILIYAIGTVGEDIEYIDALFFGAGSSTQSGLNTIDVNNLLLAQQIVIYFATMCTNPIFINTMVVEWRLRGFAKRFKQEEQRQMERYKARGRSRSIISQQDGRSVELAERGESRAKSESPASITRKEAALVAAANESAIADDSTDHLATSSSSEDQTVVERPATPHNFTRTITFAEAPSPARNRRESAGEPTRLVQPRSMTEHIAFVEKQRNASVEGDTLYIPDPRAVERGEGPRQVDHKVERVRSAEEPASKHPTSLAFRTRSNESDGPNHGQDSNLVSVSEDGPLTNFWGRPRSAGKSIFSRNKLDRADTSATGDANGSKIRRRSTTFQTFISTESRTKDMPYLQFTPTVGRNSMFVALTEQQKEELGGLEYRSLKTLKRVLWSFFFGFHIFGAMSMLWIVNAGPEYQAVLDTNAITSRPWWAFFTSASMFNDLGFTLTADSMNSFNFAVWPLLCGSFLIVIGNTGFPIMLRFVIWVTALIVEGIRGTDVPTYEELRFLLDHPRRCFTLLFPSKETWWLFMVLVILNGLDLFFFCVLDINDGTVGSLPAGIQVLDGLFQAVSTRTAGFSVVGIANLHVAVQVSYLIMMYISVLPIAISVRRTNVYEEQSLGIYHSHAMDDEELDKSFIKTHLRHQLSYDLWYIFSGLFFICIIEGGQLANTNEYSFSVFSVLFEIVSAYGTVGLSLGYPNTNASFSAQFHALSKLIIIAMQIRGRHRGLPYALDRAVMLPGDLKQQQAEDIIEGQHRRSASAGEADAQAPFGFPRTMTGKSRRDSQSGLARRMTNTASSFLSGALIAGPSMAKDHRD